MSPQRGLRTLSDTDGAELLRIARAALREHLASGFLPPGQPHRPSLIEPSGAAVVLHLRGAESIASDVDGAEPLFRAVQHLAIEAVAQLEVALEDLPELHIEVHVLSPLSPLAATDVLEPGRDGVVVTRGPRRAVLLPSASANLSASAILDTTAKKACLRPTDTDATFSRFTALRFADG